MADYLRDGVHIPNPDPIKVPWNFDQTGGDIAVQQIFPSYDGRLDRDVLLGYAQEKRRYIREQFAMSLFEAIEQSKDPVVVSVAEEIRLNYFGLNQDRYKLVARLTPTQTRDVVFVKNPGFSRSFVEHVEATRRQPTFWQRLKYLFTGNEEVLK